METMSLDNLTLSEAMSSSQEPTSDKPAVSSDIDPAGSVDISGLCFAILSVCRKIRPTGETE